MLLAGAGKGRFMRRNTILTLAALSLLSLSACDTLRREAGLTKQSPDEFAVEAYVVK